MRLSDGVILAVSESVSIHERLLLTIGVEIDGELGLLSTGGRRRKLTRLRND